MFRCYEPACVAQREKTKHAGELRDRYKTHVYCKPCATWWERHPDRRGKREYCGCCKNVCREGPRNGTNGATRYAKQKAAKIDSGIPNKIMKSIKSEVRNMVHNSFPEIVIPLPLDPQAAEVSLLSTKVMREQAQLK